MGTWFVIHVKPTYFETTCCNAIEKYSTSDSKKIDIDFTYCEQVRWPPPLALESTYRPRRLHLSIDV